MTWNKGLPEIGQSLYSCVSQCLYDVYSYEPAYTSYGLKP
uniref:Cell division protein kinase n=1 Tax=Siphoviridae sp. ctkyH28 TaxID=2827585 RepID=A0A8S5LML9_9CAUD|nr:MAG TPA: cell division protein kinase [Siphoviridae sp. ctkyH28]